MLLFDCSSGQAKRSFSKRFCHMQKPLRCQYKILMLVFLRLIKAYKTGSKGLSPNSCSTINDRPLICFLNSTGCTCTYTALTITPGCISASPLLGLNLNLPPGGYQQKH